MENQKFYVGIHLVYSEKKVQKYLSSKIALPIRLTAPILDWLLSTSYGSVHGKFKIVIVIDHQYRCVSILC